ncbi:MAG TPA: right-handed parallel beta-helix repeat-containing protein, partial [Vicinamibacterales bacterium]|nr:right-handed parallel beta-helix repeat-containing protein [Vicinamibacterales bacterium]
MLPISYREGLGSCLGASLRAVCLATTLAAAATSQAATYYVRNGGDDGKDGLSHGSAWATLDKVNRHAFLPSDRVFFLDGDRWVGQLRINWPGTATNPAIVGTYYLVDGAPRRGFRRRAVIDGTDTVPQQFDGLVRVRGDYVRVEGLAVINSEGRGIQFEYSDNGVIIDCVTTNSYKSGIKVLGSDDSLVARNLVTRAGVASPEDGGTWGGAIELVASDDGIIRGNTVSEVYGEGINVNHGSMNSMIEGNYVFAARALGIYVDAAPNTTVRRNIVIGTSNPEFWRSGRSSGTGIVLNNEEYHYLAHGGELASNVQSQRAKIYDNLIAATAAGVGFWGQLAETTFDDVLVFNNSFVDNDTQLVVRGKPKPRAQFINNILVSISP